MPKLCDIMEKRVEKKFVKKSYRPWDLSGTESSAGIPQSVNLANDTPSETLSKKALDTEISIIKPLEKDSHATLENITDNNIGNEKETTREHLDNIKETVYKQQDNNRVTTQEHPDNTIDNKLDNNFDINFYVESIKKLAGIQEKIFFFVVEMCCSRGILETGNILTADLATAANCTIGSAKTSLIRLSEKKLVIRKEGKRSRGGHIVLAINQELRTAALQVKQEKEMMPILTNRVLLKLQQSDNKLGNNLDNNAYSNRSSNNYINNTTSIPKDWEEIDFNALSVIGFSKTQLLQLYEKQLNTPEVIQESINQFAFALENSPKVKAYPDPLNVLMGVLRKGGSWIEKNYISLKEKTLKDLYERKRIEAERILQLEDKILEEEYRTWSSSLSEDDRHKILINSPKNNLMSKELMIKTEEGFLQNYFRMNIYNK